MIDSKIHFMRLSLISCQYFKLFQLPKYRNNIKMNAWRIKKKLLFNMSRLYLFLLEKK